MLTPSRRWDIFCAVVDNYGDAGVAWRLARTLATEHRLPVRLYIDAPATLARLAPGVDATRAVQRVAGLELRVWGGPRAPLPGARPAAVVVEAFGCGLPPSYLEAMAARSRPPVWINLEHLSAEKWIEGCHGLASPHPQLPLTRYFFFPGFTSASGGLLRECDLLARRDRFRADPSARASLWRSLGLPPPAPAELAVSLFCYPSAPVADLLTAWQRGERGVLCLVPPAVADAALERWTGGAGRRISTRGSLRLARLPFVPQDEYDPILWGCDMNFVRGEDSFVRAQWAARPLVWNPYPQAEDAHRLKLAAFLELYAARLQPRAARVLASFSRAWSGEGNVGGAWTALAGQLPDIAANAEAWAAALGRKRDLATALVKFSLDRL
ncbi:MAG TPA: elongation factor P maturation arginine rhamnosyltransferase EarP [Casimicrobiaceae bacterium]|nr:elongation factor P maturation arginine rhamnosyltransferase EarP [Casimicrobiaceae bacterium]